MRDTRIQVKLFEAQHEKDLEDELNRFLQKLEPTALVDLKYSTALAAQSYESRQKDGITYSFSAIVLYQKSSGSR